MTDRIVLEALEVDTVVGVHPWERRVRQTLRLDLELPVDARRAAATDALEDALDYAAVAERVRRLCAEGEWQLVETVAERVAGDLLATFRLPWVSLTVTKAGAVPRCGGIRLALTRRADDGPQAMESPPSTAST
ncbi:MAG: dihydroneopterin aldolase [Pseudomonadales bacterium]|nr:dihydroneopterin aldolase [Pseudomonadales bacterium]